VSPRLCGHSHCQHHQSPAMAVELPPLVPDLKQLLEDYLLHPEDLPIHSIEETRKYVPRVAKPERLYDPKLSGLKSSIQVKRNLSTGEIIGVEEVFSQKTGLTNKNSMSLQRDLGPPEESVRGSSSNLPFWPGGFDIENVEKELKDDNLLDFSNLLSRHPKLSSGIDFSAVEKDKPVNREPVMKDIENVKIGDLLENDDDFDIFDVAVKPKEEKIVDQSDDRIQLDPVAETEVMNTLASEEPPAPKPQVSKDVIKISEVGDAKTMAKGTEWVVVLDVNSAVEDFSAKVPDPATTYPFELDTFQKQAVMHLEQRDCVFVAAHTSAGKTVVAEYAIALSLKHMTRSIYTSPIKALSNQKYRDLKTKFTDVGLLTGDIQINPKASCLIMTTEILQSMLYNGSDVIRDLEWVIFDEVHYINNADRGHVWEEVLIMLPSHVNIVLLSATVPNTVEFADWIGRIKKRKIYVISTQKRPVPLEHFLYTGTGGKTRDERFLILDHRKTFLQSGYKQALAAKEERETKFQQQYGAKQGNRLGEKQEKHMWIGLIEHLSKRELLPVVAFTLSKKRCDSNATNLLSQDLTTKVEKGEIESFIRRCLDRLKGSDKKLPQVVHMRELLRNGIGVHHSGILPMLKEVVEMLFAKGLVKILFATETFAMGVNMPARCVVFDSIRKHDGKSVRDLLPSEYIQMAGRAGRRGLDSTGTVIILCKNDVPEVSDLNQMMLGKPSKLESQFKLTYSMMLNLLRVEALRVEDMMKRSFSESIELANQSKYSAILDKLTKQMTGQKQVECVMCNDISDYYGLACDLTQKREEVYGRIALTTSFLKTMQPGRLLVISQSKYQNFLCCLLKVEPRNKTKLTVFVLNDSSAEEESNGEMLKCMAAQEKIHVLSAPGSHELLHVTTRSIVGVTSRVLKVNADKVLENIAKKKIPRFANDPPGASLTDLISEMQRIHDRKAEGLKILSFRELGINEFDTVMEIEKLEAMRERIKTQACVECPQFAEHFSQAFTYLKTREEIGFYKHKMSEESLQLHPEYKMRLNVLTNLGYIDESMTVTLKGRIACEMGNHELMVTELLLENTFNEMPIEMIAALLSSLVFQQKLFGAEPDYTKEMLEGIDIFKKIATKIGKVQRDCNLPEPVGDFVDQFKFGLVEVVHEWAHGLPFDKIMELTEVQEGIVVKCIQRLDETLRDVRNAAKLVGDPGLAEKMERVSTAIKRDIVFAASLYTV